jgi:hypothetical protein
MEYGMESAEAAFWGLQTGTELVVILKSQMLSPRSALLGRVDPIAFDEHDNVLDFGEAT